MNRLQWMTSAIGVASIFVIGACNILSLVKLPPSATPLPGLSYCTADTLGLCVVSFGIDNNNRMLINLVKPDSSYPDFYLKIQHLDTTAVYECQTVADTPTSIYCSGDRTPLGDPVTIYVYSKARNLLIASGTLAIAAFALPTQVVVSITPTGSATETPTGSIAPTAFEIFTTAPPLTQAPSATPPPFTTPTSLNTPTRTKTPTSAAYPNP